MTGLRGEEGMTLVELLLGAVLMLIVLGATLTTFNIFERNTKTNEQQNEAQEETRRALDLMARDLRNLASPTPNLPFAVDVAASQDVIFQSEGKDKPATSLNAQNTTRVRYCLDTTSDSLYRQIQAWNTAGAPGIPSTASCPGTGWSKTLLVGNHVVNEGRPIFTYNAATLPEITEVSSQLFVDVNPGDSPVETTLQSSVFLRNQNRAPSAAFSWASMPGGNVFLNASESTDPEEKALSFEWWDEARNLKVGEGIVFTYKPPAAGWRDMKLVVKDATLETTSPTQNVCADGPGVTCP